MMNEPPEVHERMLKLAQAIHRLCGEAADDVLEVDVDYKDVLGKLVAAAALGDVLAGVIIEHSESME